MSTLPPVRILAAPGSPGGFVALVRALGAWCHPQAAGPAPVAWVASSPALARGVDPVAVWVDDAEAWQQASALGEHILVTADPAVARLGAGTVVFPYAVPGPGDRVPLAPVVRSRWRARLGLPATMVVNAADLPDGVGPTAMALASVVVATGTPLADALAWGAPCVTDAGSATALGAVAGVEAVVGRPSELASLAADLAGDDGRCAALSAAGRRLVERRADTREPARRVAAALGLPVGDAPHVRILDDLHTPPTSPLRRRVAELVAL